MNATHAGRIRSNVKFTASLMMLLAAWPAMLIAAGNPPTPDAFEQNRRLGAGVNAIGYDPLWKNRAKARFKDEYFKQIHDAGFKHIRVNLHPFRDAPSPDAQSIADDYLKTMDWAVDQALASHLMIILDFHEFKTMSKDPAANKARFLEMWRQIAERYKDRPSDVLFEILNEPHDKLTAQLWNQYMADALAVIRKSNPTRTVIVGPTFWNSVDHVKELELPADDHNLIVTVHYYKPMKFTHQGAAFVNLKDKVGVPWDGTPKDRQTIADDFNKVNTWATEHHRPIYLGEFGAFDKAEMAARARYADCVARTAEKFGWSWAWWQFEGDFVLYDIHAGHWVEPLRNALVPPKAP